MTSVPVLLISGPIGAGKTSVALAISSLLREAVVRHAVVDLDALAWCFPRPPDDLYYQTLALKNLAFVWASYRAEGAERLVIARVIESWDDLADYRAAVPGAAITVVRLRASADTLRQRLDRRGMELSKARNLRRSLDLAALLEQAGAEHHVVETDGRSIEEVARAVLDAAGW